jgi:hypothetical protein
MATSRLVAGAGAQDTSTALQVTAAGLIAPLVKALASGEEVAKAVVMAALRRMTAAVPEVPTSFVHPFYR